MKKLLFKSNKKKEYCNQKQHIKDSCFNINICPINLLSPSGYHIILLIKYAATKLRIAQRILTVNRINFTFFFSSLIGNITAAPNHPAARLIKNSEKIPNAILSMFSLYHVFNGQVDPTSSFGLRGASDARVKTLYNNGAINYGPTSGAP